MSVAEIGQLHSRYVRLSDKFKACWTYHQFGAAVYKNFLQRPLPYSFDFQNLYEAIRAASEAINTVAAADALPRIERCERELQSVVRRLIESDETINASTLRRFLEKLKQQDEKIIFNLIKFYLYANSVAGDQRDKLDFLFTKLGEDFVEERGEYWSKDSLELRKQFQSLISIRPVNFADQKEIVILIRTIRQMKEEIQQVEAFEQLTERSLLDNMRQFKHRIGDQYFHPDVLLAIVDCNVTTKNRFLRLYREEEQRIVEDSRKLLDHEEELARGFGDANPALMDEIARFRHYKQEFDDSRARSNIKHNMITQLKASMNNILAQLDRGLDSTPAEQVSSSFFLEPQHGDPVLSKFGNEPLLHDSLMKIISVLQTLDPHLGEERLAAAEETAALRIEPWEAGAYVKLYARQAMAEEETEELLLTYLRGAALRLKIEEQAQTLTKLPHEQAASPALLQSIHDSLERAKELDQLFGDLLQDGIYYSDPKVLHRLYRSRFRLLRGFSGLWLIYDKRAEKL